MDDTVSVAARIRRLAREEPDRVVLRQLALDGTTPSLTWADLDDRSDQLAGALAVRGLLPGQRLGLGLRNSLQFVLAALAAWKLGPRSRSAATSRSGSWSG